MNIEQLEKRILDKVNDTSLGVFIIDAFEQYNRLQSAPVALQVESKDEKRYKCLLCGRDKFTQKTAHKCAGGFRKRGIKWEEVSAPPSVEAQVNDVPTSSQTIAKPNVICSCDCLVGFLSGEKINKSTIDFEVQSIYKMMPKYKEHNMLKGEPLSQKEITDNRRGYLSRFKFCPYCGEKINWKQVLSNCI